MHCVWLMVVEERHFKRKKKKHLLPLLCLNSREHFNCTFRKPNCLHRGLPDVAMSSALPRDAREREKQTKKNLAVITLSSSEFRFICVRRRHETMVIITVITLRRLLGFGPCQRSGDRLGEIMNVVRRAIHSGNAGRPRE